MRLTLKNKKFIKLTILLAIFLFILIFYFNLKDDQIEVKVYKQQRTFHYDENRKWIINNNVLQYSVYSIFSPESIHLDLLLILSQGSAKDYNQDKFKCVVLDEINNINLIILPKTRFDEIKSPLFKLRCDFSNFKMFGMQPHSALKVSAIYESDFNFDEDQNIIKTINADKLPYMALQFQEAISIDSTKPKIEAVVHCLHDLNFNYSIRSEKMRIKNWIDIQRKIGIHHMQFYVMDKDSPMVEQLTIVYGDYLSFIQHSISYSSICGLH